MRLVGKHGERMAAALQGFQQIGDSRINDRAGLPVEIVVGFKIPFDRVEQGLVRGRG